MRGDELRKLQAFARGEATWAEVEGITAGDAERIARTGVELAAAGQLREAALIFEAMVEMNPLDAGAHGALGTVYQKLERAEDALRAYGAALAIDRAHPVALGNRGELLLRLGRREGFADVAAAVQADPEGKTAAGRRAARLARAITSDAVARLGVQ